MEMMKEETQYNKDTYYLSEFKKAIKKEIRKALKPIRDYIKENIHEGNKSIECDVSTKDDYNSITITTLNGCKIIINKDNINDFIMTDDDVSKVVEILKKEIIVKNDNKGSAREGNGIKF